MPKSKRKKTKQPSKLLVLGFFFLGVGVMIALFSILISSPLFLRVAPPPPTLQAEHYPENFNYYYAKIGQLVNDKNPTAAFAYLSEAMNQSPYVNRQCHSLAHTVGYFAYQKYHSFSKAMEFQNDLCGAGYVHGLVESQFSDAKDIEKEMLTICQDESVADKKGMCYHGVGHGVMSVTENDVPKSVALCQKYTDPTLQSRCAEGLFMENFTTDEDSIHNSTFLKPEDPFYPCADQPVSFKDACYFYSSIYYLNLHPQGYLAGLNHCMEAEGGYRATCARGIGSRTLKENLNNIPLVQKVCDDGPKILKPYCIEGMVSWSMVNDNSVALTTQRCSQLSEKNKDTCLKALARKANVFSD